MTTVNYTNGIVEIKQSGTEIRFRPRDLKYDDRITLLEAVGDVSISEVINTIRYLKAAPAKERLCMLEDVFGASFPCGTGEPMTREADEACGICGYPLIAGDLVHEIGENGVMCDLCYRELQQ